MVKKIVAGLIWTIVVLETLVFFLPKRELYFLGERYLEPLNIVINGEDASDFGWLFSLKGGSIVYDKMNAAENEKISFLTTIFYNRLSIASFNLSNELAAAVPARVDFLEARHTIFVPHKIFLSGEGEFGAFSGSIDLFSRKIILAINAPSQIQQKYGQIFARLEKTPEGFVYAYDY
ncbi:MAG: hypothetical protein LBP89_05695 [Helicobacteraceae bacterium]|jgi:hypothetical protein|nr:hypothetical protein [Helicobacteraceae bacterium]